VNVRALGRALALAGALGLFVIPAASARVVILGPDHWTPVAISRVVHVGGRK